MPPWLFGAVAWGAPWAEARTDHFVVWSDGGKVTAARAAQELEEFRAVIAQVYPALPDGGRPLEVVAFGTSAAFRDHTSAESRERRDIAAWSFADPPLVALDTTRDYGTLVHGAYLLQALNASRAPLPTWYHYGLADYFASTTTDGRRAKLGLAHLGFLDVLRNRRWIPVTRLLAIRDGAPELADPALRDVFDAEAWLVTHWCTGDPARSAQLVAFLDAADRGVPTAEAVEEAFGVAPEVLEDTLRGYASGLSLEYRSVTLPTPVAVPLPDAAPADPALVEAKLGLLLGLSGRTDEAVARIRAARSGAPRSVEAAEALGHLALRSGQDADATALFGEALALGSTDPLVHEAFVRGALDTSLPAQPAVEAALVRLVELAPERPYAYHARVRLAAAAGDTDARARWVEQGLAAAPGDPWLRIELAHLQHAAGKDRYARTNLDRAAGATEDVVLLQRIAELRSQLSAP